MTLLLTLAGFMALASGTWRQSAILYGRVLPLRHRLALLGSGYALLAMSLALVLTGGGVARALVGWFGELTLAAIVALVGCWIWPRRHERHRGSG